VRGGHFRRDWSRSFQGSFDLVSGARWRDGDVREGSGAAGIKEAFAFYSQVDR